MTVKNILIEGLGWVGAVLLLAGFALTSYGFLEGVSFEFQLLNLLGSGLLAVYTYIKKAYPNTVLNIIWIAISVAAIINIFI
tara:strand:+ start:3230 stop:3475 length:246 start_codon:yes stop_codon:yes gene_type:complete